MIVSPKIITIKCRWCHTLASGIWTVETENEERILPLCAHHGFNPKGDKILRVDLIKSFTTTIVQKFDKKNDDQYSPAVQNVLALMRARRDGGSTAPQFIYATDADYLQAQGDRIRREA